MVKSKTMTNIIVTLGQDIHFDKFTGNLVKFWFFLAIFEVVIKMTIEVMVSYDLWSIRTTNGSYYSKI